MAPIVATRSSRTPRRKMRSCATCKLWPSHHGGSRLPWRRSDPKWAGEASLVSETWPSTTTSASISTASGIVSNETYQFCAQPIQVEFREHDPRSQA